MKALDMLHAGDYANMHINHMKKKLDSSKEQDKAIAKSIEYVI